MSTPSAAVPANSVLPCLLLATDLRPRCDRALDRAAQLARELPANLVAFNVFEVAASPDRALAWATGQDMMETLREAQQQLARDVSGLGIRAGVRIARADDPAEAIREEAVKADCALVVAGAGDHDAFDDFLLGSTVKCLARTLPQPLLVVRQRVRGPYRRIVAATDFSVSSRHALETAGRLLPGREIILYHAAATPGGNEAQGMKEFMEIPSVAAIAGPRPVIEHGALETLLTHHVREHDVDLVVMGCHGRGGVLHALLGGSAAKLLEWLPCDTLLVREPQARP